MTFSRLAPGPWIVVMLLPVGFNELLDKRIVCGTSKTDGSKLMMSSPVDALAAVTASRRLQSASQTPSLVSAVFVTTSECAGVVVGVGVAVFVIVPRGVGVKVLVAVRVGVNVHVGVGEAVAVRVLVAVNVAVLVGVGVELLVRLLVGVDVGVFVGVSGHGNVPYLTRAPSVPPARPVRPAATILPSGCKAPAYAPSLNPPGAMEVVTIPSPSKDASSEPSSLYRTAAKSGFENWLLLPIAIIFPSG